MQLRLINSCIIALSSAFCINIDKELNLSRTSKNGEFWCPAMVLI